MSRFELGRKVYRFTRGSITKEGLENNYKKVVELWDLDGEIVDTILCQTRGSIDGHIVPSVWCVESSLLSVRFMLYVNIKNENDGRIVRVLLPQEKDLNDYNEREWEVVGFTCTDTVFQQSFDYCMQEKEISKDLNCMYFLQELNRDIKWLLGNTITEESRDNCFGLMENGVCFNSVVHSFYKYSMIYGVKNEKELGKYYMDIICPQFEKCPVNMFFNYEEFGKVIKEEQKGMFCSNGYLSEDCRNGEVEKWRELIMKN